MKRALLVTVAASIMLLAAPLSACTFQVNSQPRAASGFRDSRISWTPVPGADRYDVFVKVPSEDYRFFQVLLGDDGVVKYFNAKPFSTVTTDYTYMVIASNKDHTFACVGTTAPITLPADEDLLALTYKRVAPIVGSTQGANGSNFKTSLLLRRVSNTSGRIVFRPVRTTPSDSDPYLQYSFGPEGSAPEEYYWDDVVAAMGASGMGSLEIIPDPNTRPLVPQAFIRAYNVTPEGTFGTSVEAVLPSEWIRGGSSSGQSFVVSAPHGNLRRNVGLRSIEGATYSVNWHNAEESKGNGWHNLPPNYTFFGNVDDLFGSPVPPDAEVRVSIIFGSAIGFYTVTDNATNDPALVIQHPLNVESVTFTDW